MLAHAPVAGSRTEPQPSPGLQQQPVQNPAAALCPLATASPRTASLFPTSFKLPEPFGEKKKKKAWEWTQIKFSRLKCLWSQRKQAPRARLGCSGPCRWTKATPEHHRGTEHTQPNFLLAKYSSLTGTTVIYWYPDKQRRRQRNRGALFKISAGTSERSAVGGASIERGPQPFNCSIFPQAFWVLKFCFLSYLNIYTVNKKWELVTQSHKK